MSADGMTLYFTSNRKGGFGGKDIWYTRLQDGMWSEPINLGPNINTPGNEESPFIHPDNQTLYFSSDHHVGMGDYDYLLLEKNLMESGICLLILAILLIQLALN